METSKSSGHLIVDSVVCDRPCFLTGIQLYNDASAACTLVLYDSATAATIGKIVFKGVINAEVGGGSGQTCFSRDWVFPVECKNGLYADVTGAASGYVVEYIEQ
jgi:hypothetical protein